MPAYFFFQASKVVSLTASFARARRFGRRALPPGSDPLPVYRRFLIAFLRL
jgi:hypothetical protein